MTLKEAKKILEKEGFYVEKATRRGVFNESFTEYEDSTICEAMQVVYSAGYKILMFKHAFEARKARLKEEYEKNHIKCGEPIPGSPALKEAASQFNDALLDEQAKKIEELTKENERLKDQIAVLNACKEHNVRVYRLRIKRLGKEIARLNGIIHDKNEELKRKTKGCCELVTENLDLKESLRKTKYFLEKIKEANSKNLDTCFKNEDTIDELKKRLAEKTRLAKKYAKELSDSSLHLCKLEKQLKDKDAVSADVAEEIRLSKIREKNLTEVCQKYMKENEELKKELADKVVDKIDAQALKSAESALAEKDEVIADLSNELAATKEELEAFKESYKRRLKEDSEHFEHIQRICDVSLEKWLIESEYLEKDKPFRFPQLPELSEEEERKLSPFRDDSVGAVTNQKDCSPVKDNHPTEDNPEEVEVDEILERVRKALEEGHTVSIDYDKAEEGGDRSATIVECGKDIDDVFEEIKRLCQE